MHGQLPHNPLADAAREALDEARKTKSPIFERAAVIAMMISAAVTTAIGGLQAWHMLKRDLDRERDRERERRPDAASPPPERPRHGGTATAGMTSHGRGDDEERRWTRREERVEAAHHGRQR